MSDKSPHTANTKKQGKTLKEKRTAKKTKKTAQRRADTTTVIPPTSH